MQGCFFFSSFKQLDGILVTLYEYYTMDVLEVTQIACCLWKLVTCLVSNMYKTMLGSRRVSFLVDKLHGIGSVHRLAPTDTGSSNLGIIRVMSDTGISTGTLLYNVDIYSISLAGFLHAWLLVNCN